MLAEKGVSVRVVDMYSVKPIDRELIMCCAEETGAIVTAEEHNIYGGLGSAVSEVLANEGAGVPVEFVWHPRHLYRVCPLQGAARQVRR